MRVRRSSDGQELGDSYQYNMKIPSEIIVNLNNGGRYSFQIKELDVFVRGEWMNMIEAFRERCIIPNSSISRFGTPADMRGQL